MIFQLLRMLTAWSLVVFAAMSIWRFFKASTAQAIKMHQIPCAGCGYFSGNYTLKCTLHPHNACTDAAIGCHDYER